MIEKLKTSTLQFSNSTILIAHTFSCNFLRLFTHSIATTQNSVFLTYKVFITYSLVSQYVKDLYPNE